LRLAVCRLRNEALRVPLPRITCCCFTFLLLCFFHIIISIARSSIIMALRHFGGPAVAFAVAALSRFLRAIV
jgi:hypothetical protein